MHSGVTITLVIPCYNEANGIAQVIKDIPGYVDEILVVDNNSKDDTAKVAAEAGARVVTEMQQGYGCAHRTGFNAAAMDVIVTMDGDGSYPADQIGMAVEALQREQLDFISCARFPLKNREAMSSRNQFGNQVLNVWFGALYGKFLKDSQSGMWCFRRRILPLIHLEGTSWEFSSEVKIEGCTNRYLKFKEIHIDFHPRIGVSHFHGWWAAIKVGVRDINWLIKEKFKNRRKRQRLAYESLSEAEKQALREYPPIA
jgi:glycosyltransferase involved in cell wall biosynthesis